MNNTKRKTSKLINPKITKYIFDIYMRLDPEIQKHKIGCLPIKGRLFCSKHNKIQEFKSAYC